MNEIIYILELPKSASSNEIVVQNVMNSLIENGLNVVFISFEYLNDNTHIEYKIIFDSLLDNKKEHNLLQLLRSF